MIVILIIVAAMTDIMGEWAETWAILSIALKNGILGLILAAGLRLAILFMDVLQAVFFTRGSRFRSGYMDSHVDPGDLSLVDGELKKIGKEMIRSGPKP